jgi:hypothetical protein
MAPPLMWIRSSAASAVSPPQGTSRSRTWLALAGAVSLVVVIAGFRILLRYAESPGPSGSVLVRWPDEAPVGLDRSRPTLLVFAHPQCPCTRATIGELDRIAARCKDRIHTVVFFLAEPDLGEAWTHTGLWEQAAAIPGVDVRADVDGAVARRFGARTSGHVLLYAADGRLLFEGGITDSRGHAGDNPGEDSVVTAILEGATKTTSTPVYGCSLDSACLAPTDGGAP